MALSPSFTLAQVFARTIAWSSTDILSCSYQEGVELQKKYWQKVLENPKRGYLLFLQHPPTLTLGYRVDETAVADELNYFRKQNYAVVRSERGGLLTMHNPGQLLCYPIASLRTLKMGPREWIQYNLMSIKRVLKDFSVPAYYKMDSVGVFTANGKIASLGFRIRNGISTHGFAINVNNDLKDFYKFNPCGLCQVGADSVNQYLPGVTVEDVRAKIRNELKAL